MRTVILGDPPPEIEALISSRRSTGATGHSPLVGVEAADLESQIDWPT